MSAMNIDDINALCAEIAEETLTEAVADYCDMLDEEWVAMMEANMIFERVASEF